MINSLFSKYVWMVGIMHKSGKMSFQELEKKYEEKYKEKLPLRTFHNHKNAIEEIFDLKIRCDRKNGFRYYISGLENFRNGELCKLVKELYQSN